jgi:hypothetical protein
MLRSPIVATAGRLFLRGSAGLIFEGKRIPLINPQREIFKPQQMRYLLSIKTVFPGGKVWYDDQRDAHLTGRLPSRAPSWASPGRRDGFRAQGARGLIGAPQHGFVLFMNMSKN